MSHNSIATNHREILFKEYTKRKSKNPRYSLRAYAKLLGMTASRLSEIFSQKRGLSPELAHRIIDKLDFLDFEKALFLDLVEAEEARSPIDRELAAQRVKKKIVKYSEVDLQTFQVIADWYHYAILDYLKLEGCSHQPEQIAKHLNVDVEKIKAALERLVHLNFLEKSNDKYQVVEQRLSTPTEIPSEALKQHHEGLLDKAKTALRQQCVENRFFQAVTLPISKEDIPMVKECIVEFQEKLSAKLAASPRKNAVYAVLFNFFELTEKMGSE